MKITKREKKINKQRKQTKIILPQEKSCGKLVEYSSAFRVYGQKKIRNQGEKTKEKCTEKPN